LCVKGLLLWYVLQRCSVDHICCVVGNRNKLHLSRSSYNVNRLIFVLILKNNHVWNRCILEFWNFLVFMSNNLHTIKKLQCHCCCYCCEAWYKTLFDYCPAYLVSFSFQSWILYFLILNTVHSKVGKLYVIFFLFEIYKNGSL
jgi:hypothetical protein